MQATDNLTMFSGQFEVVRDNRFMGLFGDPNLLGVSAIFFCIYWLNEMTTHGIKNIKIIVEPTTNQSRGMAFVEMNSVDEAKAAIKFLDQKNIDGRTVKARFATALKPSSMSKTQETAKRSKDLEFKEVQLMKKKRNLEKRSSRPF
jgi:RNA recognition motif-containing protein